MLQSSRRKRRAQQKLEPEGAPLPSKRPAPKPLEEDVALLPTQKKLQQHGGSFAFPIAGFAACSVSPHGPIAVLAALVLVYAMAFAISKALEIEDDNGSTRRACDQPDPPPASPPCKQQHKQQVAPTRVAFEGMRPVMTVDDCVRAGAAAERALDVRSAVAHYSRAVELAGGSDSPDAANHEVRMCKAMCDLSFLIFDAANGGPMTRFFQCRKDETEALASRLLARATAGAMKHDAFPLLALCLGRRVLLETQPKRKLHLAREMRIACERAICADPSDGRGHFLLGRWHNDVASLPSVAKAIAGWVFGPGARLQKGTHSDAVGCCEAALRANPHNLVARVELGRAYVGMGALGKARAAFEEAVGDAARYPVEDVNDALYRQMAIDDIDRMRRGVPLGSLARPWWAL